MTRDDLERAFKDCVRRAYREDALKALEDMGYAFWTKVPDDKIDAAIGALKAVPASRAKPLQVSARAAAKQGTVADRLNAMADNIYRLRNKRA